jgi:hypothetical protein
MCKPKYGRLCNPINIVPENLVVAFGSRHYQWFVVVKLVGCGPGQERRTCLAQQGRDVAWPEKDEVSKIGNLLENNVTNTPAAPTAAPTTPRKKCHALGEFCPEK